MIGYNSGMYNKGDNNLFFGNFAGYNHTEGSNNVFIGDSAGFTNKTGHGNIFIGNNSGLNFNDLSNSLVISNGANGNDKPLILGDFVNKYVKINDGLIAKSITAIQSLEAASIEPTVTNLTTSLGTADNRWDELYVKNLNVSGDVITTLKPEAAYY